MEQINFNSFLDREDISNQIKKLLTDFTLNKNDILIKRGIYIYGYPGSGKTEFIKRLLKEINYDSVIYDAGDTRNKSIIDLITKHNMSDTNVISMMNKKKKPICIIMDEIDGMNNGDKGGINSLIKLVRPKKTKKQKTEEITFNPIICISDYHVDKKIKELMKISYTFEVKKPTNNQIRNIINATMPNIINDDNLINDIISYIQHDLRKLNFIYKLYSKNNIIENKNIIRMFIQKSYNNDSKQITSDIISNKYDIHQHNNLMNETDRTIVGLLFHENIIDQIDKMSKKEGIKLYIKLLENTCFSDYIDRITFQKQIWQFNEMSSLIKILFNNLIFHSNFTLPITKNNIRFTKILTKYSTEYNNSVFIQDLCKKFCYDKKDTLCLFNTLKEENSNEEIRSILEPYEISNLEINRIYRYIDKHNIKNTCSNDIDIDINELNCDNNAENFYE